MPTVRPAWLALVLAGSAPGVAAAQGVSLTARTVFHGYQLNVDPTAADSEVRDLNRFYQTLEANGWALVPGERVNVVFSLRYLNDFGTGFGRDTPQGATLPSVDGPNELQMLYAYVEWKDAFDFADLRLGRQVRVDELAWAAYDGLEATLHLYRDAEDYVDVSLYAGIPVRIDVVFSSEAFVGDGIEVYDGSGFLHGLTYGGDVSTVLLRDLSASLAYRQSVVFRDDPIDAFRGDLGSASASAGSTGLQESRIGGSIGYAIRPLGLNVYGHFAWDLLLGRLEQARAGAAYHPMRGLTVRAEYLRVRPWFVGDSIFNYFNIFPYDRGRLEGSWEIIPGLTANAGYFTQFAGGGPKGPRAEGTPGNEGAEFPGEEWIHGPSAGLRYRHPRFSVGGSFEASTNFSGAYAYGGNYRLFNVFGALHFLEGRLTTDARLAVTSFQNDWIEGADQGVVDEVNTSYIGSLGARAELFDFVSLRALFARNISTVVAGSYRVFTELAVRY